MHFIKCDDQINTVPNLPCKYVSNGHCLSEDQVECRDISSKRRRDVVCVGVGIVGGVGGGSGVSFVVVGSGGGGVVGVSAVLLLLY